MSRISRRSPRGPRRRPRPTRSCWAWAAAACAPRCCATCRRRGSGCRLTVLDTTDERAIARRPTPSTRPHALHRRQQERLDAGDHRARASLLERDVRPARRERRSSLHRHHRPRHVAGGAGGHARLPAHVHQPAGHRRALLRPVALRTGAGGAAWPRYRGPRPQRGGHGRGVSARHDRQSRPRARRASWPRNPPTTATS